MDNRQAFKILEKYRAGTISAKDRLLLEGWYNERAKAGRASINDHELEQNLSEIWISLEKRTKTIQLWPRIAAAAAIIFIIGGSLFFYNKYASTVRPDTNQDLAITAKNIKPGGNKAYLTLADGKRVSLTDASNGTIATEAGVEITKTADGQLVYEVGKDQGFSKISLNTIETPKGGQYEVHLPDGSKVWLNAASKLIYPASFKGYTSRNVQLIGEAYFEVAKMKIPFTVNSRRQEIEVLGTHFNVNAYTDETSVKTTLLEGAVRVVSLSSSKNADPASKTVNLLPNQQALLTGNILKITPADTEEALAWKNGKFIFVNEPIESIMRKVARWYDVDIVYQGDMTQKAFMGTISRYDDISRLLSMIAATNTVHFKVEGRRIIVMD